MTILTESSVLVTKAKPEPSIRARRIAVLASDGVEDDALAQVVRTLSARGATVQLIAPRPGHLRTASGVELRFAETKDPVKDKLRRFELLERFGAVYPTIGAAVDAYLADHSVDWTP